MEPTSNYSDRLRQFLKQTLRRTALLHVASGLISFIAAAAWVLVALVVWAALTDAPSLGVVSFVSRFTYVAFAALFFYFIVWPLIRMPRLGALAAEVERRKDLNEILRAGFEFAGDENASKRYSPALVGEVIKRAIEQVEGLKVRFLFMSRQDIALMPVAYGGLLVIAILTLAAPGPLLDASTRIVDPAAAAARAHSANLQTAPGNVTVIAGSDVTVSGLDFGHSEEDVTVAYNIAPDFWKTEPTTHVPGTTEMIGADSFDRYEYKFKDLRQSVSYYFQSGDYKTDTYTITVVHEPILTNLRLELTPPSYTGEEAVTLDDNGGNVQALEGTQVQVVAQSNNVLAKASVQFDDKAPKPVEVDGNTVKFGFQALEDGHYRVLLEDERGFSTKDPLQYSVEVFQDNPPSIEVVEPGGDTALPRNQLVDIGFVASDDYGVRSAAIFYRKGGENQYQRIGVPLRSQSGLKDIAQAYRWDLTGVQLFPGNYIEYFVQVADNNVVTGPGTARSRVYQISVPTMAELYDRIQEDDTKRDDNIKQAIEDSQEMREKLEKITREYIKTEKMEWSQKKEIDGALEKQKQIQESLDQVKQSLDETMQQLADNEMTSNEIGEKMEEIRELLDEINSDELRQQMEKLREAIEKLDPNEIKEALNNLDLDSEKMLEKLERTAQLLKQIQKEQKMEEMVRQTRDLMDEQGDLNERTEQAESGDPSEMKKLSEEQSELAQKAEELQRKAEELAKEMMDEQELSEQLSDMSKDMKSDQGPKKNMDQASQKLQQQEKSEAQKEQQEAMDKMISLFQKANNAQQQMQQSQGQKLAKNFQKFAKRTLELSFKQQQLSDVLEQRSEARERDYSQMAQDQMSYMKATESVADEIVKMAGVTTSVSPALMEALGETLDRMRNSVMFLEQNKPFMSTAHAHNAISSLNEATLEMLRGSEQCSSCNSASSGSRAQQLMQQLIPQQQDVMSQTREMMQAQMAEEMLRQKQQAQLDRLAGQQRSLQEIAKEIEKEMKGDRQGLGSLKRTIEEMEAVAKKIQGGRLDEDLVNKEQRILSRLLDSDRSINTRDYERNRESVTADDVFSKSLGTTVKRPVSHSLREEIRRAMQLKAPGEFEDLIKLYFRALAEESAASNP